MKLKEKQHTNIEMNEKKKRNFTFGKTNAKMAYQWRDLYTSRHSIRLGHAERLHSIELFSFIFI